MRYIRHTWNQLYTNLSYQNNFYIKNYKGHISNALWIFKFIYAIFLKKDYLTYKIWVSNYFPPPSFFTNFSFLLLHTCIGYTLKPITFNSSAIDQVLKDNCLLNKQLKIWEVSYKVNFGHVFTKFWHKVWTCTSLVGIWFLFLIRCGGVQIQSYVALNSLGS